MQKGSHGYPPNWRPAFVRVAHGIGYNLNCSEGSSIIIIYEKGGLGSMAKVVRARAGWESVYELLLAKKENLDADKERAKEEAIAQVEARFAEETENLNKALVAATVVEEVPDEEDGEAEAETDADTEQVETAE